MQSKTSHNMISKNGGNALIEDITGEDPRRLAIFSPDNPMSLERRIGPCEFIDNVKKSYQTNPELYSMDEHTLSKWLKQKGMQVTVTENRLRYKLWMEYDNALMDDRQMQISHLYSGVMTYDAFRNFYEHKQEKVAWLMCPPISYENAAREALGFGIDKMREILDMDPTKVEATTGARIANTKLMELQLKIVAMMDMRVHGNFTQKIEQKSLNINMTDKNAGKAIAAFAEGQSIEALEKHLDDLYDQEAKLLNVSKRKKQLPEPGDVIDVTSEPTKKPQSDF